MSRVTVWHDGQCLLCRREIALMRWLDTRGAIDFVDAAGPDTCPLDRTEMLARLHAREEGGPMVSGAAAFAAMWRAIPLLWPLGQMARNRRVCRCWSGSIAAFCWSGRGCSGGALRDRPSGDSRRRVRWR